jgi:predicted ATPase/DNA-binding CsgD family transcriptional regulator
VSVISVSAPVRRRRRAPTIGTVPGQALTPRESAILAAVGRRLSNPEIASELFISVRTVESHIAALRRKLGAERRADLIAAAGERREHEVSVRVPHNAFVGRSGDLERLAAAVQRHHCVTITGPGGVGKTRLALEFARAGDRVPIVVELEHADPDDVVARIARVLDLEAGPGADVISSIAVALASHPYLLVLDNVDRVGRAVRDAVSRLVVAVPGLRVLNTSRTPIGDGDEFVFPLAPLDVGGADAPSVAMFLDRLDATGTAMPSAADRELAARVCARLDGLPLAIELAAAVARHLSLDELSERLDRDFATLDRAEPEGRHRTLETAFDWTWDLLTDEERDVLCRLGALPRSFDVDLATAVTHAGAEGVLLRLLDHSLIVPAGGTPRRFRLLAVMREFVRARTDPGVIREVLARHAEYHAAVASDFASRARVDDSVDAMRESIRLCSEVNAALRWSIAAGHPAALPLATALSIGVEQYGSDVDSVRTIAMAARDERVLAEADPQQLLVLGFAIVFLELPLVDDLAERALAIAGDDPRSRMAAHHLAGVADAYRHRVESALEHLDIAERLAVRVGDDWDLAAIHHMRGIALHDPTIGDDDAALAELETAVRLYAAVGDGMHVNNARYMMAAVAEQSGREVDRAARWAAECVDYASRVGNEHELAHAAIVQQRLGVPDAALTLDELVATFRRVGDARCAVRSLLLAADRVSGAADTAGAGAARRGDPGRAVPLLEEALSFADDADDHAHQSAALGRLVGAYWSRGDRVRTLTTLGRLAAVAGPDAAAAACPPELLGELPVHADAVATAPAATAVGTPR